jgi:hypothetical protein
MECRREDALRFKELAGYPTLAKLDQALHQERMIRDRIVDTETLPTGAMVALKNEAFLVTETGLRLWSFIGYGELLPHRKEATLLTPPMICDVLRRGFPIHIQENQPI